MFGVQDLPLVYFGGIVFQSLLATLLFALLGVAYYQRRSRPYLLVWLAASTLLFESVIGIAGLLTSINPMLYVVVDHGLDILLISLIFAAVHFARRVEQSGTIDHQPETEP